MLIWSSWVAATDQTVVAPSTCRSISVISWGSLRRGDTPGGGVAVDGHRERGDSRAQAAARDVGRGGAGRRVGECVGRLPHRLLPRRHPLSRHHLTRCNGSVQFGEHGGDLVAGAPRQRGQLTDLGHIAGQLGGAKLGHGGGRRIGTADQVADTGTQQGGDQDRCDPAEEQGAVLPGSWTGLKVRGWTGPACHVQRLGLR
jgi:hypothetical protein